MNRLRTLISMLTVLAGLSVGLSGQDLITHLFNDGKLDPFWACTVKSPNYTIAEEGRVKTFWTEVGYDGTRTDKGAELCCDDIRFLKEGWYGVTINLGEDYPLDKHAGVAQIFQFVSDSFWTWGGIVDMEFGDLTFTHRSNGGSSSNVHTVLYEDFPKETDVDIIIHFVLSQEGNGEIQIWIDGESVYHVENTNFGFGTWVDDVQDGEYTFVTFKAGMYNYDDSNYTPGETRTIYYDNISWYNGSNGYDIVDPKDAPRDYVSCAGADPFSRLEAEEFCGESGTQSEDTSDEGGGKNVGYIDSGDWLNFGEVDFGAGAIAFDARVAAKKAGGDIEIRLGSEIGQLVGTATVVTTGGWQNWETVSIDLDEEIEGIQDLYLVFVGEESSIFNLNWVSFIKSADNVNLALDGVATQSSTDFEGEALRAIDGNKSGLWDESSVTHTTAELNPWWEVDLGAVQSIGDINVYPRTDECCTARFSLFTVSILDADRNEVFSKSYTNEQKTALVVATRGVDGQIIRVQLDDENSLSLAEVEVYPYVDTDSDEDGMLDSVDPDDDNDGYLDDDDVFPTNANEWADIDGDAIGDNSDTDNDNDGVDDVSDPFPLDSAEWVDTDLDGIGNNADADDDGDGVEDVDDLYPLDAGEWADANENGIPDNSETSGDFINISTRAFVLDGDKVVIAGFTIEGTQDATVLIQGVGSELGQDPFLLEDNIVDTKITVYDVNATVIASNDDWDSDSEEEALNAAANETTAASVLLPGSKSSALVLTLKPGGYTVLLEDQDQVGGVALIEVYYLATSNSSPELVHPGGWLLADDLALIRTKVAAQEEPWYSAWLEMENDIIDETYKATVSPAITDSNAIQRQGHAAYLLALKWVASGNQAYATAGINIIDAWASTVTTLDTNNSPLREGIGSNKMANAAEILAWGFNGEAGWSASKIIEAQNWFENVIYPITSTGPSRSMNWGTSCLAGNMSMAVFCDDITMFNAAIDAYKYGFVDTDDGCAGVTQYIINSEGQCFESERDQVHTQGGIAHLVEPALIAWNQGVDLVSFENDRLVAGMEYSAKYNLFNDVSWTNDVPNPCNQSFGWLNRGSISDEGRGEFSPIYVMASSLFTRAGKSHPYTTEVITNENYDQPESYNDDHPGAGTLCFTKE